MGNFYESIFSMEALCLPVMTRGKGADNLVADPVRFQVFLKERRLVPVRRKTICKFRPVL